MPTVLIKRGARAQLDVLAAANQLLPGELYLITDEGRLAVGTAVNAYEPAAKSSEAGGGSASTIVQCDQALPVYIQRAPYGAAAWTIVRGDGLRATPSNNPSYTTAAAAWTDRTTLDYE